MVISLINQEILLYCSIKPKTRFIVSFCFYNTIIILQYYDVLLKNVLIFYIQIATVFTCLIHITPKNYLIYKNQ